MTLSNLTLLEISLVTIAQIPQVSPDEFAKLTKAQLGMFSFDHLDAMSHAQKQAYNTALANAH
jgi:hypothetical protein